MDVRFLPKTSWEVQCENCLLRRFNHFRALAEHEVRFMRGFKTGELRVDAGATLLVEGAHSAHLFSVLSGTAFRYKILPDGRRQIMNYAFPGDLIGLQGSLMEEMQHSVEVLSPLLLCVFQRDRMETLFEECPSLAFDVTWLAAREEQILDEALLALGRRSALERCAYLIAHLYQRARAVRLVEGSRIMMPITQQHLADTLGLSIVHTNKTIKKLTDRKLIRWRDRGCEVRDEDGLLTIAGWEGFPNERRPFI